MKYNISIETRRRFAFIETCLYWGMGVTAKYLGEVFGIARPNAQRILKSYKAIDPETIIYDAKLKKSLAGQGFEAKYISMDSRRYLDYLRGSTFADHYWEADDWVESEAIKVIDSSHYIKPNFDEVSIKNIINAIQYKKAVSVYYFSKNMTQYLLISPLHLVYASGRYHIRAFSHDTEFFLDLVLSRIRGAEFVEDVNWQSKKNDDEWDSFTDLCFLPNPELPQQVIEAIHHDYSLVDGIYKIQRVRRALALYVEREMLRVDFQYSIPLWKRVVEIK